MVDRAGGGRVAQCRCGVGAKTSVDVELIRANAAGPSRALWCAKVHLHVGKRRLYVTGSSAAAVVPEKLSTGFIKRKRDQWQLTG
jgi:hypothetical protein